MSPPERLAFMKGVGFPPDWDDGRVMECFVKESAWERAVCHQLGVLTETDKAVQAGVIQAEFARRGYNVAVWALGVAILAALLALIALFK
jgi:hypothetical protein